MTAFLFVAVMVMASIAPSVNAQQPAPAPPPQPQVDTPEAKASRDLERIGEKATREKAVRKLKAALDTAQRAYPWTQTGASVRVRNCRSDDPVVKDLRDAVRYYARAHGLPPDVDELIDEMETMFGIGQSEFDIDVLELTGAEAEERRTAFSKRWGTSFEIFDALQVLKEIKACEAAAPAPARTVSDAGPPSNDGLSKNAKFAIAGGAVLVGGVGLAALSGSSDTNTSPPTTNVSRFYGNFTATLNILSTSVPGCGQLGTSQVPVTLNGNPDGSGFVLNKGGLVFNGVMQADGRFRVTRSGPMNFPGLPNGTSVTWEYDGTGRTDGLTGNGLATVPPGGPCPGAEISTFLEGMRRN